MCDLEKLFLLEDVVKLFPGRQKDSVNWDAVTAFIGSGSGYSQNYLRKLHTFYAAVKTADCIGLLESEFEKYGNNISWALHRFELAEFRALNHKVFLYFLSFHLFSLFLGHVQCLGLLP